MSFNPSTLSEKMLFNTVRIEAVQVDGGPLGQGTGFFFHYNFGTNRLVHVIVTNKHVVKGAAYIDTFVHTRTQDGSFSEHAMPIRLPLAHCIHHPRDEVDVCIIPCGSLFGGDHRIQSMQLTEDNIPSEAILEGLTAMEDTVMIGYPNGLYDTVHNLPILRRGTTASHPSMDFDGGPVGILDLACFPGSSGSPVVILNEGTFVHKERGVLSGSRLYFLGIAFGMAVYRADGTIEKREIPATLVRTPVTGIPIHITYYVKSRMLKDFRPIIEEAMARAAQAASNST